MEIGQIKTLLQFGFPESRLALSRPEEPVGDLTHQQYVETRQILPRMVAKDVTYELPSCLFDLTLHRTHAGREFGDLVIYFLDVEQTPSAADMDPYFQDKVEAFAKAYLSDEGAEQLVKLLSPPIDPPISPDEALTSREACFSLFGVRESRAVLLWLLDVEQWDELSFCRAQIVGAKRYWMRRSALI